MRLLVSRYVVLLRAIRRKLMLGIILLIILIVLLLGAFPTWPHSREWGYGPSGIIGVILVIVLILVLMRIII